jgi:hypothetical protein
VAPELLAARLESRLVLVVLVAAATEETAQLLGVMAQLILVVAAAETVETAQAFIAMLATVVKVL